ncbi:MAG TPA: molybdate ABC transporter substrate-binding protein, partial [Xanthomonadales bacterium]|nr:molybdate ABC transporter substrate-binding protein [Xanthomonadales bacterium]
RMLAEQFNAAHTDQVVMIFGSSGKLAAQIQQGAPFDILMSADAERPEKLEAAGKAISGTRMTYAIGKLSLWSSKEGFVDASGNVLRSGNFSKLAMANPRHAPYGAAAREVLEKMGLQDELKPKIVLGGNIDQAFQYITSGNAELGFVASSQLTQSIWGSQGSRWDVPESWYSPIEQQAILVHDKPAARAFLEALSSPAARQLIQSHGYAVP